jgi:hypothetical protein
VKHDRAGQTPATPSCNQTTQEHPQAAEAT